MADNVRRTRGRRSRRRVCSFCLDKAESIDYKDVSRLRKYITNAAKYCPDEFPAIAQSIKGN